MKFYCMAVEVRIPGGGWHFRSRQKNVDLAYLTGSWKAKLLLELYVV